MRGNSFLELPIFLEQLTNMTPSESQDPQSRTQRIVQIHRSIDEVNINIKRKNPNYLRI